MSAHRRVERIVEDLEAQGAKVQRTRDGYLVYMENGVTALFHFSESDHRAEKNSRSRVRRGGYIWPPDKEGFKG